MRKLLMVLSLVIVAANVQASEKMEILNSDTDTVKYWILDSVAD